MQLPVLVISALVRFLSLWTVIWKTKKIIIISVKLSLSIIFLAENTNDFYMPNFPTIHEPMQSLKYHG
jgi:hypothetical protein